MRTRTPVRSLFISDLHLGCRYCQAELLLNMLRDVQPETLYLVGDIIDGWKMQQKVYWNDTFSFVVRRIIGMMKRGTRVVYIAGNHDEFLRSFLPHQFGHLELVNESVHVTVTGKKILVTHGDQFDTTIRYKWLYLLGDKAYSLAMWTNKIYNKYRQWRGQPYWSLSLMLKRNVKEALNYINKFEHFLVEHAKQMDCEGVICGHIHSPGICQIEGIEYYNCGDWVESCTALIEDFDGGITLKHYPEVI